MNKVFSWRVPVAALCLPWLAFAQAGRPDPADPKAPAPQLRYSSAFADYKPWQDSPPGNWRAVNDKVRDATANAAGHAGHASPASAPGAAPAAASAAAAKASMPAHHHHHMRGGRP